MLQIREWVRLLHDHPAGERSGGLRAREMEHLLEVLGDQQPHLCAFLLEHDVGRHGRPVQDRPDLARAHVGARQQGGGSVDDSDGLILGGRRCLQELDLAASLVEEQEVGERPAYVDTEACAHWRSARRFGPISGVFSPLTVHRTRDAGVTSSMPGPALIDRRSLSRFRGNSCLAREIRLRLRRPNRVEPRGEEPPHGVFPATYHDRRPVQAPQTSILDHSHCDRHRADLSVLLQAVPGLHRRRDSQRPLQQRPVLVRLPGRGGRVRGRSLAVLPPEHVPRRHGAGTSRGSSTIPSRSRSSQASSSWPAPLCSRSRCSAST